jgi:hypothetical protein
VQQAVSDGDSVKYHPLKTRKVVSSCVNKQRDRQDVTCCNELVRQELAYIYHVNVWYWGGGGDQLQAAASARQVRPGTTGHGHHQCPPAEGHRNIYKGASTINLHNRICADELQMYRNLATKYWDKRINLSVLTVICIDAYLFFQQVVHANNRTMSCLEFFGRLADKLI